MQEQGIGNWINKSLRWVGLKYYLVKHNNQFFGFIFDSFFYYYYTSGLKFYIPRDLTTRAFRTRFLFNSYESEERKLVRKYLDPDSTVLELGGSMGVVSCITNKLLKTPKNHLVVEANPKLIQTLKKNKQINSCHFEIIQCLISNKSEGDFYLHDLVVGGSANRKTDKKIKVPVKTVSQLERQYNLKFDTLIIDIEGGELNFLNENKEFIKRQKTVIIEIHNFINKNNEKKCRDLMSKSGLAKKEKSGTTQVWIRE